MSRRLRARVALAPLLLALALLLACGGMVSAPAVPEGVPDGGELAAPTEPATEPCEICVDPARRYCSDSSCARGTFFCDLYGCFPCTRCADSSELCAHARCLP